MEFGGVATDRFDKFHIELCQFKWYLMPVEIQRIHLMFMLNVRTSAKIKGYANVFCTREMYKSVIFTYTLILAQST